MHDRATLDLVGDIYAAVTEPERWGAVLEAVSDGHRGAAVVLGRQNFAGGAQNLMSCRVPEGAFDVFAEEFASPERNDFIRRLPDMDLTRPITPEQHWGEEAFLAGPLYQQVYRPRGLRYFILAVLYREPQWACWLAMGRSADAGRFEKGEPARLSFVSGHLARAMALRNALDDSVSDKAMLAEIIDHFDRGALAVDAGGRIRFANRAAVAILARGDGLVAANDRLRAVRRDETMLLQRLFVEAAQTSAGDGVKPGGALGVTRTGGAQSYPVVVSPLAAACLHEPSALVLVADPEGPAPPVERLRDLHGFTRAEARLAARLIAGDTPAEAAAALGVSINTVRTHLRGLLAKTDTRRQAELTMRLGKSFTE